MENESETRITVRFPKEITEDLRVLARIDSRSLNSEIVYACQQFIAPRRKEIKREQQRIADLTKDTPTKE